MIYELCRIKAKPNTFRSIGERAVQLSSKGQLLGVWQSEIGPLFEIMMLRAWPDIITQQLAHKEQLTSPDQLALGVDENISFECFEKFPFLPDVTPFPTGKVFELRTYFLRPGGLKPTLEGWKNALGPAQEYTSHLVINMYAVDGPPRIVHLWAFDSLEQRAELRSKYYSVKLWPPVGGPEQIASACNSILLPVY